MQNLATIHRKSVVLVSGGGRGVTAKCVMKLAEKQPANFILLGRSSIEESLPEWSINCPDDSELKRRVMQFLAKSGEKPTPQTVEKQFRNIRAQEEIESTISNIQETGSTVEYVNVDVANLSHLKEKIRGPIQRMGQVTGVIHGAGSLADKRIEKKSTKDYETVISPKVDGLKNLLEVAPIANLDFLVLFSSIVGVFGNIGQSDYAIANEVLNKTAYQVKRENPACRVLSINWGPWDSGMVTPELKQAFAERNMQVIPTESGAELLANELANHTLVGDEPIQIVVGALPTMPAGVQSQDLKKYKIRRNLILDSNPFLLDHQIGNNPVLPATCAASWVASSCEQLYPGYVFREITNYKVLKGIVFDASLAKEHILDLEEIEKTPQGQITFAAKITSKNDNGKPVFHYSLNVILHKEIPIPPKIRISIPENASKSTEIDGKILYENGTLFHGPAFQGVQRVLDISEGRLILECNLPVIPPEKQGQFPLQTSNPFIYDAIVQSLLIWTQRYYQAPCLPSSLVRLEQFKAIPFNQTCLVEMKIISHTATSVVADLQVADAKGNVYVIFTGLQGTISPLLKRFIGSKSDPIESGQDG
jgi:NADP-dependent 3-hydroxy acid dehydrogenase YdfG